MWSLLRGGRAVRRLRICFSKGEEVKFISHLDLVRTFVRALRRAEFPVAYSGGYNPQPRLVFAAALPVGITSSGEYLDVCLTRPMDLEAVRGGLNRQMPGGLAVRAAAYVNLGAPPLMQEVNAAVYLISSADIKRIPAVQWEEAAEKILQSRKIVVERQGKRKRSKPVDIRPFVFYIGFIREKEMVTGLKFVLQTGNRGGARPTELLAVFQDYGLPVDPFDSQIHREGLFVRSSGRLNPPLEEMPSPILPEIKEVG